MSTKLDPATLRFAANVCAKDARHNEASRDNARAAGRETVALCRGSDAETLMRMATWLRSEARRIEAKQKRSAKRVRRG
jgi:hypothetical protein